MERRQVERKGNLWSGGKGREEENGKGGVKEERKDRKVRRGKRKDK